MPNSWITAVARARKELKIKGFTPVKKGTKFYALAKKYHKPKTTTTTTKKKKTGGSIKTAGAIKKRGRPKGKKRKKGGSFWGDVGKVAKTGMGIASTVAPLVPYMVG